MKSVDISEDLKEMTLAEERKKVVETHKSKVSQWLNKQFKKFAHIEKT